MSFFHFGSCFAVFVLISNFYILFITARHMIPGLELDQTTNITIAILRGINSSLNSASFGDPWLYGTQAAIDALPWSFRNKSITISVVETGNEPETAFFATLTAVNNTAILGPIDNALAPAVAGVAARSGINVIAPMISSAEMLDQHRFPSFLSTRPSAEDTGIMVARFVNAMGWKQVATLIAFQNNAIASLQGFRTAINHVTILSSQTISITDNTFREQLSVIKSSGARIIITAYGGFVADTLFDEAYALQMFGPGSGYTWISADFGASVSSFDHYGSMLFGYTMLVPATYDGTNPNTIAFINQMHSILYPNTTLDQFLQFYRTVFAAVQYDATNVLMNGLHTLLELKYNCSNATDAPNAISEAAGNGTLPECTQFRNEGDEDKSLRRLILSQRTQGLSSSISFDNSGKALFPFIVLQIQKTPSGALTFAVPAIITAQGQLIQTGTYQWADGTSMTPLDHEQASHVILQHSERSYIAMSTLTAVVLLMIIGYTIFNLCYRANSIIRMSSPRMNLLILLGAALLVCDVFLQLPQPTNTTCTIQVWMWPIGFTLLFGSLFAKSWRVFQILFQKRLIDVKKISDLALVKVIILLLLVDFLILSLWNFDDNVVARVLYFFLWL